MSNLGEVEFRIIVRSQTKRVGKHGSRSERDLLSKLGEVEFRIIVFAQFLCCHLWDMWSRAAIEKNEFFLTN